MKKNLPWHGPYLRACSRSTLIAMKLFLLFTFAAVFQLHAGVFSQQVRFDLNLQDQTLPEAVQQVAQKSDLLFLLNNELFNAEQIVTVDLKDVNLSEAMQVLLEGTNLTYSVVENYLVIKAKPSQSLPQMQKPEEIELTGTVTAREDGLPLPGVNVFFKGTTIGTVTDIDGKFTLKTNAVDRILVFSLVGMKTVEIQVGSQRIFNIQMESDLVGLDEIVVVGFGTESRKLLTGSVSDFKPSNVEEVPVANLDVALQGRVTGVQVTQNSGTPGGGVSVRIRGNNSISADNQPLYVVDGVPVMSGDFSQIGYSGQTINAISDINPNDIESMTILKDAAATALYGARASRGVVLITTKRGSQQKTRFQFNASTGVQQVAKTLDMLDASEWMIYRNEQKVNEGAPPIFSEDEIANPEVNTNWLDEVFRTGIMSNYELSASGGNEKTTFFLSGSYLNEEGVLIGTDYDRLSGRLNIDHQVNERLKIGAGVSLSSSLNNRVEGDQSLNGPLPNAISLPAIYPVYNEDGTYNEDGPYANPVAIANEAVNELRNYRSLANVFANYFITDGLSFETKWAIDYLNLEEHSYDPVTTRQGKKYNGLGFDATTRASNFNTYNLLRYEKSWFENHTFEGMLGYSYERFFDKRSFLRGTDFPNEYFQYLTSAANITEASSSVVEDRTNSYFGRVKYNINNRYLFTASARYDGSSNFGANNKYGFFPALAMAWRISEESFMDNLTFVDEFKLRGSFGYTGNDKISRFASLSLFDGRGNYNRQPGIYPIQMPNPDLKWETSRQLNIGFDLTIWDSRLNLNLDYYYSLTTDLLLARPIPPSSGFTSVWENIGEMENRGVELALQTTNIRNDNLEWTSTLTVTANKNKVLKLYNGQPIDNIGRGSNYIGEGEPLGVFYGYRSLGVDPSTGDIVFDDVNKDGKITAEDRTKIGDPNPKLFGGLDNNLKWRQWNMRMFFQFSYGNEIYNGTRVYIESLKGEDNQLTTILDRWHQPGDQTEIPRATLADPNNNNRHSSRFIEDGSYLRLKELAISYTFPKSITNNLKLSNLKLFVSAYNLLTFTNYSGMDPEINYAGNDNLRIGTDFFTYPQSRRFMIGLNVGF